MTHFKRFPVLFGLVVLTAVLLRIPGLAERPMHADEAVNGIKCSDMLAGNYQYNPHEFHGPSLVLFTCFINGFFPGKPVEKITETSLRIVPVLFSLIMILSLYGFRKYFGDLWVYASALFLGISTLFSYYSRYYIHEMLLVCFSVLLLISLIHYAASPNWIWAVAIGFAAGLMHATKETAILSWLAILLSMISVRIITGINAIQIRLKHGFLILFVLITVSALCYSQAFKNPASILDSWTAYRNFWFHGTSHSIHSYPFTEYLRRLLFYRLDDGPIFTEGFILLLALIGFIRIFVQRKRVSVWPVFLGFYTVFQTLIYGAIPYKTPWLTLNFWLGWILIAAFGLSYIFNSNTRFPVRNTLKAVCIAGLILLLYQSILANGKLSSDPKNPWAYAHPDREISRIRTTLCNLAEKTSEGKALYIQIIYPGHDYWPLPWMLRDFQRIGWSDYIDFNAVSASVILIAPELESDLTRKLYIYPPPGKRDLYLTLFSEPVAIRPGALINGYIRKEMVDGLKNDFIKTMH